MRRGEYGLFTLLMIFLVVNPHLAQARRSLKWYETVYGSVSESDHSLAAKAFDVFARVRSAADKPGDRYPKLLIVPKQKDPWAVCLEDGGILLSQSALEFCYYGVPEAVGDARLAFVFGHEIAHLAKGDFWHADIAEFIRRAGSHKKGLEEFYKLNTDPEEIEIRELKADYHGLLYASMAGYHPRQIILDRDVNFFQAWTNQLPGKIAYAAVSYPSPELRAKQLLVTLENIYDQIKIFEIGLRLFQKGDYDYALSCLTQFQTHFPCREVFNNIGLIHFQKAIDLLDRADRDEAGYFKLATLFDSETRAGKRGAAPAKRDRAGLVAGFQEEIDAAIANFKNACQRDNYYLPSRVNLSSAHIIRKEYSNALAILEDAEKIKKADADILANRAAALYLFGQREQIDTAKPVIELLQGILAVHTNHTAALYNYGRIIFEQKGPREANEIWSRFLTNEPKGRYAEQVKKLLGEKVYVSSLPDTQFEIPPPIKLGYITRETREILDKYHRQNIWLAPSANGICYDKGDIRVWEIDGYVKYVEASLLPEMRLFDVTAKYGMPKKIIALGQGRHTYVYENFSLDIENQKAVKVVYFLYL